MLCSHVWLVSSPALFEIWTNESPALDLPKAEQQTLMSDEVASLLSQSSIAGDQVDPGYFVLVASDIDCSDLLGKDCHQSSSRHKIEGSLSQGVLVATTYAMKIVPSLECSGEPNPSLVTWTSSSLMVPSSRDLFTAYDSDVPIVQTLLI